MKLGICYVIGGDKKQYDNLRRSLRSIERLTGYDITVFIDEFGYGPKVWEEFPYPVQYKQIVDLWEINPPGTFVDHHIWSQKYIVVERAINAKMDYIIYVDVDTVFANNTIHHLIQQARGRFTVTQHFWTKDSVEFVEKTNPKDLKAFKHAALAIGVTETFPIATGGVFFLENNYRTRQIIDEVITADNTIYIARNSPFIDRFTDEYILSYVLSKHPENVYWANGALNHCSMVEMPLAMLAPQYNDTRIYGCNPFDDCFTPVTCLHCDTTRRDPSGPWPEPLKTSIKQAFYLE